MWFLLSSVNSVHSIALRSEPLTSLQILHIVSGDLRQAETLIFLITKVNSVRCSCALYLKRCSQLLFVCVYKTSTFGPSIARNYGSTVSKNYIQLQPKLRFVDGRIVSLRAICMGNRIKFEPHGYKFLHIFKKIQVSISAK